MLALPASFPTLLPKLAWITLAAQPGTVSIVKFREKLEQSLEPAVVAEAQVRAKELTAKVEANKRARAAQ